MTNERFDEFTAITRTKLIDEEEFISTTANIENIRSMIMTSGQVIEAKRLQRLQELIQSLPPVNAYLLDYIISLCM
jgi:hypothetical protein